MYVMPFSVKSTKYGWKGDFTLEMPVSIDDVELIEKRFGSLDRMVNRACAQFRVDVANPMREEKTPEAAQVVAEGFIDDGKKSGGVKVLRPIITADEVEEQGFSPEDLAFLKKKGFIIPE